MKVPILAVGFLFAAVLSGVVRTTTAQAQYGQSELEKVYSDESHCLVGPEIRSEKDNPVSCYCRDAIADARYVYFTYLLSGKDANLNGTFLALVQHAKEVCGQNDDAILKATETDNWKWNGPEVVRTYPPDDVIHQIKPDNHGVIPVEYTVVILHRDPQGRVIKTESFTALDRIPAKLMERKLPTQQDPTRKASRKR